jgi:hypothetical protein
MGSGLAESPTIAFFISAGTESALDQLRSVPYLPVVVPERDSERSELSSRPIARARRPGRTEPSSKVT